MILILISYECSRSLLCAPEIHYLSYSIETFINSSSSKYGESCNCIFNSPTFLRRFRGNYPTEKGESIYQQIFAHVVIRLRAVSYFLQSRWGNRYSQKTSYQNHLRVSLYLFPRRSPCNEIIVHHFNCRILGVTKRIVSRTVHEYENKFKRVPKLRYTVKKSSYGNNSKTKTEEFF